MKNGKNLTREQKKFLVSKGYEVNCYLAVKNTPEVLVIYNKETKQTEEVIKKTIRIPTKVIQYSHT